METITVSAEQIREFTKERWREYRKNRTLMRKCSNCFEKWEKTGRKIGEQKPLYYPEGYTGKCLCGGELSEPRLICGI